MPSAAWMHRESDRLWQRHERHGRVGLPFYRDRHACLLAPGAPEILAAYTAFCEVLAPAATGELMEQLEVLTGEKEPPKPQPAWQEGYFVELEDWPSLGWYLSQKRRGRYLDLVAQRAGLGDMQKSVLRQWLGGADLPAIAKHIRRRRPVAEQLLDEVLESLCGLGGHRSETCTHRPLEAAS